MLLLYVSYTHLTGLQTHEEELLLWSCVSSSQVTPVTRTACLLAATCRAPRLSSPTTTPSRPPWTDTERGWPTWVSPGPPASSTAPPTLLTQVSRFKLSHLDQSSSIWEAESGTESGWTHNPKHTALVIIQGNNVMLWISSWSSWNRLWKLWLELKVFS